MLPTPQNILLGIWDYTKTVLLGIGVLLVIVPQTQVLLCLVGVVLVFFHHWVFGAVLCAIALIAFLLHGMVDRGLR